MDSVLAGHLGTAIEYQKFPGDFATVNVDLDFEILDVRGNRLTNMVDVMVSKTDVPAPRVGRDRIRLPPEAPTVAGREYTVRQIMDEDDATYKLRCDQ